MARNLQGQLFLNGIRKAVANRGLVRLGIGDGGIPSDNEGWTNRIFPTTPIKLIVGPKPGVNTMHSSGACVYETGLHSGFCFAICRCCCVHRLIGLLLRCPLQQDTAAWLPYSCASGMFLKCKSTWFYRCQAQACDSLYISWILCTLLTSCRTLSQRLFATMVLKRC